MDPISLIVAALAAGASAGAMEGLKDDLREKAKGAYAKLRGLVERRFRGNAAAELVLAEHTADAETYQAPLAKKLAEAGAAGDADLVAAAAELMKLLDQAGGRAGRYNVTIASSQGVQIGDGGIQINRF